MKKVREFFNDGRLSILIIVAILVIDQIIKIAVRTNMCLGESIRVTDWFFIDFIENKGMAFGMTFINKIFLSLLRLGAIIIIGYYIWKQVKVHARTRYIVFLSMIVAGAAGNLFDSMFYGLIFDEATPFTVSSLVPFGNGYAGFLMGKVVDMFYFPLIVTTWPNWVPFVGGNEFVFFSPVFNFADACVSVGVVLLLLFSRKDLETLSFFKKSETKKDNIEGDNK
ncbi:MAG: lipoprotein signal peptidase [Prevotella sp.]|jgi:signal peptidase II|nr:lipoprotein signal peptidase [Prevotella sp.]MCI1281588.1 lipoprotein signal peptidase [Prevotella sp.]